MKILSELNFKNINNGTISAKYIKFYDNSNRCIDVEFINKLDFDIDAFSFEIKTYDIDGEELETQNHVVKSPLKVDESLICPNYVLNEKAVRGIITILNVIKSDLSSYSINKVINFATEEEITKVIQNILDSGNINYRPTINVVKEQKKEIIPNVIPNQKTEKVVKPVQIKERPVVKPTGVNKYRVEQYPNTSLDKYNKIMFILTIFVLVLMFGVPHRLLLDDGTNIHDITLCASVLFIIPCIVMSITYLVKTKGNEFIERLPIFTNLFVNIFLMVIWIILIYILSDMMSIDFISTLCEIILLGYLLFIWIYFIVAIVKCCKNKFSFTSKYDFVFSILYIIGTWVFTFAVLFVGEYLW